MTPNQDQHPTDLREYVRVLRARKWEVAAVTVVLLAATMFFTFRQTPVYEGVTKVLVKPVPTATASISIPQAPNLDTERELILSQAVAQKVRQQTRTSLSVDTLLRHVRVDVVADTEVLLVQYLDPVPKTSARFANAFAAAYVDFRSEQAIDQFTSAAAGVQRRIDGLNAALTEVNRKVDATTDIPLKESLQSQRDTLIAQLGVLSQRLLDLQSSASTALSAAQVVQQAEIPKTPVSPNKVRNGILALFAGLALGIGFSFLRERLDDRIKSRHELERRLGAPVLAAVPKVGGWRRGEEAQLVMRSDPRSPVSESYRTLGTNVQYLASQQGLKVLMVTSSLGGDGKTTTSANLAVVLAQAGRRVILISADLRRPRLHHFFGLRNEMGLSNVLGNGTGLAQVARDPGVANLRVICGGPIPTNPAELLGSRRASEFIDSLRDVSDFVILDTPPVLAVADASILAPIVDGTVFVMDSERSSRSALAQSRDQLENAGARIIGSVYNNFDPSQASSYPYSYNYYYQYYGTDEDGGTNGHGKARMRLGRRSRHHATRSSGRASLNGFEQRAKATSER